MSRLNFLSKQKGTFKMYIQNLVFWLSNDVFMKSQGNTKHHPMELMFEIFKITFSQQKMRTSLVSFYLTEN